MVAKVRKQAQTKGEQVKEKKVQATKKETKKIKETNKGKKKTVKEVEEKVIVKETVDQKSKKIKKEEEKKVVQKKVEVEEEEEREHLSYEELQVETKKKLAEAVEKLKKKIKLDKKQVNKCIGALLKHHESSKSGDILDINDQLVYLEVIVSSVPSSYSIRPQQIGLTHPIYSAKYQSQFCVFSTDPQRTFKDKIQDMDLPCLAKVVGHEKLFKKYPTYMDKRQLANEFDLFFADHTVYSLLNKLYGKAFYQRKKIPFAINCNQVPIDLKDQFGTDYQSYLNDLANHTYFSQGNGPVYTFKVGRVDMSVKQLEENISQVVFQGLACIIKDDQNVDSIHQISIKTKGSPSLPLVTLLSQTEIEAFKS